MTHSQKKKKTTHRIQTSMTSMLEFLDKWEVPKYKRKWFTIMKNMSKTENSVDRLNK